MAIFRASQPTQQISGKAERPWLLEGAGMELSKPCPAFLSQHHPALHKPPGMCGKPSGWRTLHR